MTAKERAYLAVDIGGTKLSAGIVSGNGRVLAQDRCETPSEGVWDVLAGLVERVQVRLPALGESASDEFNLGMEKRLGEQIMRQIRPDPDYLDDPALLD